MKKFLGTMILAFVTIHAISQPVKTLVKGVISESITKSPVTGASVSLGGRQTLTDDKGMFSLSYVPAGMYELTVSSLGYAAYHQNIKVEKGMTDVMITLAPTPLYLQPLEVHSVRASLKAPFAKTDLGKEQIAANNLGQDIPFLLDQTPSVVVNSDAGNGVGYTGIRIRGSDASRINVTLNGIPYNDAESMGTFFVDLPDFASSVNSIQVQRGIGTSSNGAGAFGATINLATNEFNDKAYGELNNSYGSFNTWKNTLMAGTGLIDGHFTVDARVSSIRSDGYIQRAKSDLQSFYFSTAYLNKRSSLRLNIFSGKEKTYQAWYGVPDYLLATDRTNNPAGTEKAGEPYTNQTDNYTQTHYQLFFNHSFSTRWSFNTAAFLTRGKGYYEEYKAAQSYSKYGLPNVVTGSTTYTKTDLVRQRWLDNYFYGQIASLQYKDNNNELTFGGGWTTYDGKHYGTIAWMQTGTVPAGYRYYNHPAIKNDANFYTKWQRRLSTNWSGFADLQYRYVKHDMDGFQDNPTLHVNRDFHFVNPKAGITYAKDGWQAFFSYALAHKEPNRDDFEAGISHQPKAETMHDMELGIEKRNSTYHFGANFYYMYYYNQLVLSGQINDVGAYTRVNIPHSYRLGIELQGGAVVNEWLNISANIALSTNKISSYIEYIDNFDTGLQDAVLHKNTSISFSPDIVAGAVINITPVKNIGIAFTSKYVGKEYMDNSQNENRKLEPFFVQNVRATWNIYKWLFKEWNIIGQVNNVFDKKYEPNGYTYNYISGGKLNTENGYFPMAGTNFMLGLNIKL